MDSCAESLDLPIDLSLCIDAKLIMKSVLGDRARLAENLDIELDIEHVEMVELLR